MSRERLSHHQLKLMRSLSTRRYHRSPPGTIGNTILSLSDRGYIKLTPPAYGGSTRWAQFNAILTPDGARALERAAKQERIDANS